MILAVLVHILSFIYDQIHKEIDLVTISDFCSMIQNPATLKRTEFGNL